MQMNKTELVFKLGINLFKFAHYKLTKLTQQLKLLQLKKRKR